ncbi:DUF3021 domain-containing protein [Anaerosporobacter faecicola]|uniref:DUF3021 domain-containing protein n=1 Tax=Anaerosporobacter faecicola TaxID=2718714 RepID=UPI00143B354F|nr:DUF3021 domain-containing protein [Anaerosporobacter faecicola]
MLKKAVIRGLNSFMYSVAINVVFAVIMMAVKKDPDFLPVIPDFVAHFPNKTYAFLVQCLLIGLTSTAFGFWSIIMEFERISLLVQSILYFIATTMVWLPVAMYCWNLGKYKVSLIASVISYMISYSVTWVIQYRTCKESINQINKKLGEMRVEE